MSSGAPEVPEVPVPVPEVPEVPVPEVPAAGGEGASVCVFFRMKKCRFGERCRLSHSLPSPEESGAAEQEEEERKEEEEEERKEKKKKKGRGNKTAKRDQPERREQRKKPRMRTAEEVISRILWDDSVDPAGFLVGYVDRFLGVLERPFCDFSWDTAPVDCDYATELALPQHRIQYFSYGGRRVWDRHTRTDRVFGSTGQTLAPPFGREEEAQGEQGQETTKEPPEEEEEEEPEEPEEEEEEEPEEPEEPEEEEEEEEEEEQQRKILSSDGGNTDQEQKLNRREASAADGSSPQEEEPGHQSVKEAESESQWEEAGEDAETHLEAPPTHLEAPPTNGRPPKKRPTHFVGFRANTPAVLSSFQALQKEVCALLPDSAPHWSSASTLHVTLCLLVLPDSAQVDAAVEILQRFAELDRNPPLAVTFPPKLKHFKGAVLYLSPQPQLRLQQLNAGLQEAYRGAGLLHRDSYSPRYHLTLAKVTEREGGRPFDGVGELKLARGLNFGRLPINCLHLCEADGGRNDGFYHIVSTVTLR